MLYGYMFGFDPIYMGIVVVSLVIGALSQSYIKKTYARWSQIETSFSLTGAQIAQNMLSDLGSASTSIGHVDGDLTDYFDPRDNSLHLSPANFSQASVASVAVACHEAGHAVQHARGFVFAQLRSLCVPLVNFAQNSWSAILFMGVFLNVIQLVQFGVLLFFAVVIFQIITLPVEIDASRRALEYLRQAGTPIDEAGARSVLIAAALTYVSAALISILQLVYMLSRVRGSRD